ncbi:hypothetical protein N7512_009637 [Penicillium capsulatum]|nr:hypothetical protein N7512_009637 [Penicillium capsulatum]
MRTRSQPVSPGGLVSLDDLPRRRRATRSTSAQPQDADITESTQGPQPTEHKSAPRSRQTREVRITEDEDPVIPSIEAMDDKPVGGPASGDNGSSSRRSHYNPSGSRRHRFPNEHVAVELPSTQWLPSKEDSSIPRNRSSYLDIARRRRNEADGRVDKTLYRLDNLVNQNESDMEASASNKRQTVSTDVVAPAIANPATPEKALPSTPKTAPAVSSEASPSWSKWIFNSVSRRWTNIRDRFGPHPTPPTPEAQSAVEKPTSPPAPTQDSPSIQAVPSAQAVQSARLTPHRRRPSVGMITRPRSARSTRTARLTRHEQTADQLAHPRRRSVTKHEPYNYRTTPNFSKELLDRYTGPAKNPQTDASAADVTEIRVNHEQVNHSEESTDKVGPRKRKRDSPEVIPNPPGCSYGFDPVYFIIDSDDEEEAERDKARRAAEALKQRTEEIAEQNDDAPRAKKARVQEPPLQRRRLGTSRQAAGNASTTTFTNTLTEAPPSLFAKPVPSQHPVSLPAASTPASTLEVPEPEPSKPEPSKLEISKPEAPKPEVSKPKAPEAPVSQPQASEVEETQTPIGSSQKFGMFKNDGASVNFFFPHTPKAPRNLSPTSRKTQVSVFQAFFA